MKKNVLSDSPDPTFNKKNHDVYLAKAADAIRAGKEGLNDFNKLMKAKYFIEVGSIDWVDPAENVNRTYDTGLLDPEKVYRTEKEERTYLENQEDKNTLMQIALEKENIPVIILLYKGYRPTHEQFVKIASLIVISSKLDEGLQKDVLLKIKPIFTKLQELEDKIDDLNKRGCSDDVTTAKKLSNTLRCALIDFVNKDDPNCYLNADIIIKSCNQAIINAKPSLATHRGWAPFFEELIGVMTLFVSKIITLIATGGEWSLTDSGLIKTDTVKLLDTMTDTFKSMKAELQALTKPEGEPEVDPGNKLSH